MLRKWLAAMVTCHADQDGHRGVFETCPCPQSAEAEQLPPRTGRHRLPGNPFPLGYPERAGNQGAERRNPAQPATLGTTPFPDHASRWIGCRQARGLVAGSRFHGGGRRPAARQTRLVLFTPFKAPDVWEMLVSGNPRENRQMKPQSQMIPSPISIRRKAPHVDPAAPTEATDSNRLWKFPCPTGTTRTKARPLSRSTKVALANQL